MIPVLQNVGPETFAACIAFIEPREYRCISLMSHLVAPEGPVFPEKAVKDFVYLSKNDGASGIDGILLLGHNGILFHCLHENLDEKAYETVLAEFLSKRKIHCVLGEHSGTRFLERLIPAKFDTGIDFQLMTLETVPPDGQSGPTRIPALEDGKITIAKGTKRDIDELLPLQEGYELEEVVPPNGLFNRAACRANLARNLEKQHIYYAESGKAYIAKAGTNALGLNWEQIGGVYTAPGFRGQGIAAFLVAHTARERMRTGRKIALFVKESNIFALKSYKNAGFTPKNLFRITYFTYN